MNIINFTEHLPAYLYKQTSEKILNSNTENSSVAFDKSLVFSDDIEWIIKTSAHLKLSYVVLITDSARLATIGSIPKFNFPIEVFRTDEKNQTSQCVQNAKLYLSLIEVQETFELFKTESKALAASMETNIAIAKELNRALLPNPTPPHFQGIQIHFKFFPSSGTGGDYFDVFDWGDKRRLGILIAQSSTHTLAAHFLSILFKIKADEFKTRFSKPHQFAEFLSQELHTFLKGEMRFPFFFAIFDKHRLTLDYVNCSSIKPLSLSADKVHEINLHQQEPLSVQANSFQTHQYKLKPGENFFLFTEGLTSLIPQDTLKTLILQENTEDPKSLLLALNLEVRSKKTDELTQDISWIHLKIDSNILHLE